MSFEVDAFMGAPAPTPPARAAAPRAAPEGPSFDDHLNEATAEPESAEAKPVDTKTDNKTKETPEQPDQPAAAPAAPAPPPQAPIVIQLIAEAPPTSEAPIEAEAAPETLEAPAQAPSAPPAAPVKAQTAKSEAPDQGAEAPIAPVETKNDAPAKRDAPMKTETPKAEGPVAEPAPEATPQAQAPQQDAQPQQPQPQLIAQAAPAPVERVTTPTQASSADIEAEAPRETPAVEAPEDARVAKAEAEPRADAPKANATPAANAKDSFAALAALAAQDGGQQAQAPAHTTPAAAIGGTELTTQSGQVMAESVARTAPAATQVSREIIRRFNGQTTSLELRLDPPELGKVEVRLEVSRDHKVTAVVAAENPAALAELARNARDLQQALQSAGLDLADNGLSFDLKQQRENSADSENGSSRSNANGDDTAQTSTPAPSRPIGLASWRGVRVDLVA